jgi:hypothetical protein
MGAHHVLKSALKYRFAHDWWYFSRYDGGDISHICKQMFAISSHLSLDAHQIVK